MQTVPIDDDGAPGPGGVFREGVGGGGVGTTDSSKGVCKYKAFEKLATMSKGGTNIYECATSGSVLLSQTSSFLLKRTSGAVRALQ